MLTDLLTWAMIILIPAAIVFLAWLIAHTFRKIIGPSDTPSQNTESVKRPYRLRFAAIIVTPIIGFVAIFFVAAVLLDGVYGGLWMLSGGAVYALDIALIGSGAILFLISIANTRQIKKDLLSNPDQTDSILRSSKKLHYVTRIFAVIIILPLAYVSLQYAYTVITTYAQDQQFCKTAQKVSYTDKDEMMKDFLASLNESDVEKASGFYYKGQAGSVVIPTIGYLIEDKKADYAQYDFPDWSPCYADGSGNQSCAVEIGGSGVHSILKEAKANHWYMLANENYDYPTSCKD